MILIRALVLIFLCFPALAQIAPVQDNLHLLSKKENQQLTRHLLSLPIKILVVTKDVPTTEALSIGRDTGVDIVILQNKTTTRTEISAKLEEFLPDSTVSKIVQASNDSNYYQFFTKLSSNLSKEVPISTKDPINPIYWILFFVLVIVFLFLFPELTGILISIVLTSKDSYSRTDNIFSGGGSDDEK